MDDARDRALVDDERHRDRPARIADHKRARAVDRIDDDEAAARKALEIVDGLLGEPACVGQRFLQAALQKRIGGEIGVRDRRSAGLRHDAGGGSAPGLKYSSASAPASRAAETKRSRAASASVSASTLKETYPWRRRLAACISCIGLPAQSQRAPRPYPIETIGGASAARTASATARPSNSC